MLLRSYFATSVEAALSKARRELGEDAMLVDSRPAQDKTRHLGKYEVVIAVDAGAARPAQPPDSAPQREELLERSVAQLRIEMHRMRDEVSRVSSLSGTTFGAFQDPQLTGLYTDLISRDFMPDIAHELVASSGDSVSRDLPRQERMQQLKVAVAAELSRRLPSCRSDTSRDSIGASAGPRAIVLFGPSGAGKTTTLVKLAIVCGVSKRRPVRVISVDNLRIGASDQLRSFCAILGAPFQQLETASQIGSAVGETSGRSLVLIDTPGMGPREADLLVEFGRAIGTRQGFERNLVLSAVTKPDELRTMVDRFAACAPHSLTFTHLDETHSKGGMVSLSIARGLPIAYLCNGQQIPDDFYYADAAKLARLCWDWHEAGPTVDSERQAGRAAAGLG